MTECRSHQCMQDNTANKTQKNNPPILSICQQKNYKSMNWPKKRHCLNTMKISCNYHENIFKNFKNILKSLNKLFKKEDKQY